MESSSHIRSATTEEIERVSDRQFWQQAQLGQYHLTEVLGELVDSVNPLTIAPQRRSDSTSSVSEVAGEPVTLTPSHIDTYDAHMQVSITGREAGFEFEDVLYERLRLRTTFDKILREKDVRRNYEHITAIDFMLIKETDSYPEYITIQCKYWDKPVPSNISKHYTYDVKKMSEHMKCKPIVAIYASREGLTKPAMDCFREDNISEGREIFVSVVADTIEGLTLATLGAIPQRFRI